MQLRFCLKFEDGFEILRFEKKLQLKFMFSNKATKIEKIFTVDLTLTT